MIHLACMAGSISIMGAGWLKVFNWREMGSPEKSGLS